MKLIQYLLLPFVLLSLTSCGSDDDGPEPQVCDLVVTTNQFDMITKDMGFDAIESLLGPPTNSFSSGAAASYTWGFCDNSELFVSVVFNDMKLASKLRSFANSSCSSNINQESFDAIEVGDSIDDMQTLFNDEGDTYSVLYSIESPFVETATTVWYDCDDVNKRIQVVFENGVSVSKEESL